MFSSLQFSVSQTVFTESVGPIRRKVHMLKFNHRWTGEYCTIHAMINSCIALQLLCPKYLELATDVEIQMS